MLNSFELLYPDESYLISEYRLYLYPTDLRGLSVIVNDFGDRLEYKSSFIYDEYPDKEYLLRTLKLLHSIVRKTYPDKSNNELITYYKIADIMFINSMYERKKRYDDHQNTIMPRL